MGPSASTSPGREVGRDLATAIVLFHGAIASRLGLGPTEWRCWGLLDQHGPSTAGRLAELSGFTTGAITGIVDRLERAGYARRKRSPDDRRSVIIHPLRVAQLRRRVRPVFASLGKSMAAAASHYSRKELLAVHDYLLKTIQVLHAETVKLSGNKR